MELKIRPALPPARVFSYQHPSAPDARVVLVPARRALPVCTDGVVELHDEGLVSEVSGVSAALAGIPLSNPTVPTEEPVPTELSTSPRVELVGATGGIMPVPASVLSSDGDGVIVSIAIESKEVYYRAKFAVVDEGSTPVSQICVHYLEGLM